MAYLSRRGFDRVAALVLAVLILGGSWFRHATFRSTDYDLAVVEQTLWKMSRGHGATSTLTAWNAFADHLSPILVPFAALYRLAATPLWLFAAQGVAIGIAYLAARPLARAAGLDEDGWPVRSLLVALFLSPAIWNAVLFDFHTTTLAVPVLMVGITAALRSHHRTMWLCLGALCILRDDLAVAGAAFAVMGWRSDERAGRRQRILLIAGALAWTGAGTKLAEAMGSTRHWDLRYGYLGDSAVDAALHLPSSLLALMQHLFVPENVIPVVALLLPLAFLPIGRPGWLALVGLLALPILAADDVNFRSPAFHYAAPLFPFLFAAAAATLARYSVVRATALASVASLANRQRRAGFALVATAAAGFAVIGPIETRALSIPAAAGADVRRALDTIAPSDAVVASTYVSAHLARRNDLRPFPAGILDVNWVTPLDPRVTDASAAAQDAIDVVVLARPSQVREMRLYGDAGTVLTRAGFERETFGSVTVYRRAEPRDTR